MKTLKLKQVEHNIKIGKECPYFEPNVKEDCLLELDGEVIGFYIKDVTKHSRKLKQLIAIANKEFRSDNVPKVEMMRGPRGTNADVLKRKIEGNERVTQYSTILGSVAANPVMRRPYPNVSNVHRNKKAQTFIKAMWGACIEAEQIVKELTYLNIEGTVNIILTKRNNANGGCLNVPDYNVTFEQADNSMLVYPAWKNVHGVTPIKQITEDGYRNSLIFYPLKAFKGI